MVYTAQLIVSENRSTGDLATGYDKSIPGMIRFGAGFAHIFLGSVADWSMK